MRKLPKSGQLRESIRIWKRVNEPNPRGEIVSTNRDIVSVWAMVTPMTPVPQLAGAVSELDDSSHKAIFYSPNIGIDTNLRAHWRGEDYAIKKVVNDPVNRFTTIYMSELEEGQ